jgi:hypothetical protein
MYHLIDESFLEVESNATQSHQAQFALRLWRQTQRIA